MTSKAVNQCRKAASIATLLYQAKVVTNEAVAFQGPAREIAARQADVSPVSEETWAMVIVILGQLEKAGL